MSSPYFLSQTSAPGGSTPGDFSGPMGAVIDGDYRTHLWRRWGEGRTLLWMMLNPSTADQVSNDPTIGRLTRFSQLWGYDALHVVNLFTLRMTDSNELVGARRTLEQLGAPQAHEALVEAVLATAADVIVCGWGSRGTHMGQDQRMLAAIRTLGVVPFCLGWNKDGTPVHPLYQSSHARLKVLK